MGISDIMNLHFKNIRDDRVDEITRLNGNYPPPTPSNYRRRV